MTTESTVRTALASQFEAFAIRDRVRVGERHTVYAVSADGHRAACKVTDCQPATLAREGEVLRAVTDGTSVPAPDVLASTVLGSGTPVPDATDVDEGVLVLEWVEGDRFDGRDLGDQNPARLRAAGRALARLHDATEDWFDGHGPLREGAAPHESADGPLAVDGPRDWPDRLSEFVTRWADALAGTPHAEVGAAVVDAVEAHRDALADDSPVLVQGEASPDHVLFDGDAVAALVDWEQSQAAPAAFDVAWAERDLLGRPVESGVHDGLRTALVDGYVAERDVAPGFHDRRELYRGAFAMRELTLVHDSEMPPQSDRDDYADLLADYVAERLAVAGAPDSTVERARVDV